MSPALVDDLVAFLRTELGRDLRAVVHYTPRGYDAVFVRGPDPTAAGRERVSRAVSEFTGATLDRLRRESHAAVDQLRWSIRCSDQGTALHFVLDQGEGLVVALEAGALLARDPFIARCLDELQFNSS